MKWMVRKQVLLLVLTALVAVALGLSVSAKLEGGYVAGDFHQHTTFTDGANPFATVMDKNDQFGLDWWANSEHGGAFPTDAYGPVLGSGYDTGTYARYLDTLGPILGDPAGMSGTHKNAWRWQSLLQYSFNDVLVARGIYHKPIIQGYEWNVPGHEHCSFGVIAGEFGNSATAEAVAKFEYYWDANDRDSSGGPGGAWTGKSTLSNTHAKALAALGWLKNTYPTTSYIVFAHPERKGAGDPTYVGSGSRGYNISDFRDFNNAAPDIAFGFESMPGHQKESRGTSGPSTADRGGYGSGAIGGATFGGVGAYAARIGGMWDAMLGEGRHWWLFASSDFHNTGGDFWPGEYQKTYTYVRDKQDPQAIVDGLRSGNSFIVSGDLIDGLQFTAQYSSEKATMGDTLAVAPKKGTGNPVKITIKFKSPAMNNNGQVVMVDHIDLIGGEVTGFVAPGSANYNNPVNPTTKVIARFTSADWEMDADGWYVIQYHTRLDRNMYFRLRGTHLGVNVANETQDGEPLSDSLMSPNTPAKAWADLWFYSNPIFVNVAK
jgi:hypothetical protein